jgi:hypothetical protein
MSIHACDLIAFLEGYAATEDALRHADVDVLPAPVVDVLPAPVVDVASSSSESSCRLILILLIKVIELNKIGYSRVPRWASTNNDFV